MADKKSLKHAQAVALVIGALSADYVSSDPAVHQRWRRFVEKKFPHKPEHWDPPVEVIQAASKALRGWAQQVVLDELFDLLPEIIIILEKERNEPPCPSPGEDGQPST
jgi:hypothetical protein